MSGIPIGACTNCRYKFATYGEKFCPGCGRVRVERTMSGSSVESYTVKMRDGAKVGPVPLETLHAMLRDGAILPDTPIRCEDTGEVIFADELPPIIATTPLSRPVANTPRLQTLTPKHKVIPLPLVIAFGCFAFCILLSFFYFNYKSLAATVSEVRCVPIISGNGERVTAVQIKIRNMGQGEIGSVYANMTGYDSNNNITQFVNHYCIYAGSHPLQPSKVGTNFDDERGGFFMPPETVRAGVEIVEVRAVTDADRQMYSVVKQ